MSSHSDGTVVDAASRFTSKLSPGASATDDGLGPPELEATRE